MATKTTNKFIAEGWEVKDFEGRIVAQATNPEFARWITDLLNADTADKSSDDTEDATSVG